jgi:hypothetical protein
MTTAIRMLTVALALLVGCAHQAENRPDIFETTVGQRANFDLTCNERLHLIRLGERAFGAVGCGRRASYTCLCLYNVMGDCTQAACAPDSIVALPVTTPPPVPPRSSGSPVDPYASDAPPGKAPASAPVSPAD